MVCACRVPYQCMRSLVSPQPQLEHVPRFQVVGRKVPRRSPVLPGSSVYGGVAKSRVSGVSPICFICIRGAYILTCNNATKGPMGRGGGTANFGEVEHANSRTARIRTCWTALSISRWGKSIAGASCAAEPVNVDQPRSDAAMQPGSRAAGRATSS